MARAATVSKPTDNRQSIAANPTAKLVYLYETQRRLDWLHEDMAAIQQQIQALRVIGNDTRTHRYVGLSIVSAINSSLDDLATMRRVETVVNGLRYAMEDDFRRLAPAPSPGRGLPDAASGTHLGSEDLARLILDLTGMHVREAAATISAPLPQPNFTRPQNLACAVRNARLIHRWGRTADQCAASDANHSGATTPAPNGDRGNDGEGGAACLPSAMAGILGDPAGITSYTDAYAASWQSQAHLFATGQAIDNDTNRRRFVFKDGSYVDIQSHVPALKRSADSRFISTVMVGSAAIAGAFIGGPITAVAASATALAVVELTYPYDAAWQGYTIQYFKSDTEKSPWATAYFYGWQRAISIADKVKIPINEASGSPANFADDPGRFSWWSWRSGTAAALAPEAEASIVRIDSETQKLIEIMAGASSTNAGGPLSMGDQSPGTPALLAHGAAPGGARHNTAALQHIAGASV